MVSYYSIIYIHPNTLTDELIAVGLLTGGQDGPRFHLSDSRMRLLKHQMHRSTYTAVHRQLKYLGDKVEKYKSESNGMLLFDMEFSDEQLEKMSKKTKRGIRFSKPTMVAEIINDMLHAQFVSKMLGEKVVLVKKVKRNFYFKWRNVLQENAYNHLVKDTKLSDYSDSPFVNIKIEALDKETKEIYRPINFNSSSKTIANRFKEMVLLANELKDYKVFAVANEPSSKDLKELWKQLQKSDKVELIKLDEFVSKIKENN